MDVKGDQLQWFTGFLIKSQKAAVLNLSQINNLQTNFINQVLENLKKEKFIPHLKKIFGMLIQLICNQ